MITLYGIWWQLDSHKRKESPPTHLQTLDDLHQTFNFNNKQLVHMLKNNV
jgi:hypothetical protein